MRLSSLFLVAGAALASAFDFDHVDPTKESTLFNSVKVPPLLELTPDNFVDAVESTKHIFIKHYSPYCVHCMDFAPTFQTLYEFYYTSKPEGTDKSFTEYYDFRFATVNCIAYYDMCQEHQVKSYPSSILYVNGKLVDLVKGVKSMQVLSTLVETTLEEAHPGSRPAKLLLPEPGDKQPPVPGEEKVAAADDKSAASVSPAPTAAGKEKSVAKTATAKSAETKPAKLAKPAPKPAPIPTKERGSANLGGAPVVLTTENFDELVTESKKAWFIKFYAPWCHFCHELAPKWTQMAKEMQNKLDVGEVNCDQEGKLCKKLKVNAYPALIFFEGEERIEYQGLRGLGDLVRFAEQGYELTGSVPDVDAESFEELEAKEDVIFVYLYDVATTSEDFKAVQKLPLHLIGRAKLVTTSDPALCERFKVTTWPRLLVSREGRPTYYNSLTPAELRDVPQLLGWVKSVWLPIVPELTAMSAREIMDGKIVVLGILKRGQDSDSESSFKSVNGELKSAANDWMDKQIQDFQLERQKLRDAKQLRIDEAEDRNDQRGVRNAKNIVIDMKRSDRMEVAFAWVDGVFWQRWIKSTYGVDVRDGERVVINDEDNRRYWDTTGTGSHIAVSRASITETLEKVVSSPYAIAPKYTISSFSKVLFNIGKFWSEHTYMAVMGTVGSIYLVVTWLGRKSKNGGGGGNMKLDDPVTGLGIKRAEAGFSSEGTGKYD